jgi:hypothetical protein
MFAMNHFNIYEKTCDSFSNPTTNNILSTFINHTSIAKFEFVSKKFLVIDNNLFAVDFY